MDFETLQLRLKSFRLKPTKQEEKRKVSTWSLRSSLLVVWFKPERSSSSSPLRLGRLGCLCAVIEGSSPSRGHTGGGGKLKGPEGGQVLVRRAQVPPRHKALISGERGDQFFERKKFSLLLGSGQSLQVFREFKQPRGAFWLSSQVFVGCWPTDWSVLDMLEKHQFRLRHPNDQFQISWFVTELHGGRKVLAHEQRKYLVMHRWKTTKNRPHATFTGSPTLKYHLNFIKACNSGSELSAQRRSIL